MIRYAGLSVTGRKVNGVNDDRILINGRIADRLEGEAETLLAVVLDGVGGEAHGDEAAQLAAETLSVLVGDATENDIQQAVGNANQAILHAQGADRAHAHMATTVAGLAWKGVDYITFNLGDSRVYHLGTYFSQLTRDHTYRRMVQDATIGPVVILPEQAHIITRCLGNQGNNQADMLLGRDRIRTGDWFLLCSDGLHDVVADEQMEEMLRAHEGPLLDLCEALVQQALNNGSQDNISIILCHVEEIT